jgi:hypothetical protein
VLIVKRSRHNAHSHRLAKRRSHPQLRGKELPIPRRSRHSYRLWLEDRSTRQQLRDWNRIWLPT